MQVQLTIRVRTDVLTGLNNRHDLPRALGATLPGDSVVLADLDHFKQYNDRFGHQAGDVVLARADDALYAAKAAGRATSRVHRTS